MTHESSDVEFALASTHPLGKCDAEFKVSVPSALEDQLKFLAVAHGQTLAAYCRDVLMDHAFGRAHVVRLSVQRPLRSVGQG
jgi:hypothetical protein